MEPIKVLVTREDANALRAEVVGHKEIAIQRGKKASIAIGKLALHNPHLFNIHKGGERDDGVKVVSRQLRKMSYAVVEERQDIKFERGDTFEEALGHLIQHNREEFNVLEFIHIRK